MLGLVDEHAQLATTHCMNSINQWSVHMTFSHTSTFLVLPSFNNVIPVMILQNRGVKLNIGCSSYTSSQSGVPLGLCLNLSTGLRKRVVGVVVVLLLLLSGDIETNPGPVGEF